MRVGRDLDKRLAVLRAIRLSCHMRHGAIDKGRLGDMTSCLSASLAQGRLEPIGHIPGVRSPVARVLFDPAFPQVSSHVRMSKRPASEQILLK
jgi:hypothetical protein